MNNFEKACLTACENQVNSIKLTEPPVYSKKHKEKIELIANGKSTFATKANYIKLSLLAACILTLILSITAFSNQEQTMKSKELNCIDGSIIFGDTSSIYSNTLEKSGITSDGYFIPRQAFFSLSDGEYSYVDSFSYGYIPEGYTQQREEYVKIGVDPCYLCYAVFGNENNETIYVSKNSERSTIPVKINNIDTDIERFADNGVNYVYSDKVGIEYTTPSQVLLWDKKGYIYEIQAPLSVTKAELMKIAEGME